MIFKYQSHNNELKITAGDYTYCFPKISPAQASSVFVFFTDRQDNEWCDLGVALFAELWFKRPHDYLFSDICHVVEIGMKLCEYGIDMFNLPFIAPEMIIPVAQFISDSEREGVSDRVEFYHQLHSFISDLHRVKVSV